MDVDCKGEEFYFCRKEIYSHRLESSCVHSKTTIVSKYETVNIRTGHESNIIFKVKMSFSHYFLFHEYLADHKICFDVKISTAQHGTDSEWSLGSCDSIGIKYSKHTKYLERCCLQPGEHILTCINRRNPYGWDSGYIEIQGHRFCDDFMSHRMIQKINIRSMNKTNFKLLCL